MLEKLVSTFLTGYLGEYINNLDKRNINVKLWSGNINLNNLTINTKSLSLSGLPINIKEGIIGKLSINIPWVSLRSSPIKIEISDIIIIIQPNSAVGGYICEEMERDEEYRKKVDLLSAFEVKMQNQGEDYNNNNNNNNNTSSSSDDDDNSDNLQSSTIKNSKTKPKNSTKNSKKNKNINLEDNNNNNNNNNTDSINKDASFLGRLKASMTNNIQISISNVVITYQDFVTDPLHPVIFTIRIDKFNIQSCDEEYRAAFVDPRNCSLLYKLVDMVGFSVQIEHFCTKGRGSSSSDVCQWRTCKEILVEMNNNNNNNNKSYLEEADGDGSKTSSINSNTFHNNNNNNEKHFLISPMDINLRVQYQPIILLPHIPKWSVSAAITQKTLIRIDRIQWDCLWRSVRYIEQYDERKVFLRYKPADEYTPKSNPRLWWHYCIQSVLFIVRKEMRRGYFDWEEYKKRKGLQREYVELFKRSKDYEWLLPLSEEERQRYIIIERELPIDMLKIGRSFAYAKIEIERERYKEKVAEAADIEARRRAAQGVTLVNNDGSLVNGNNNNNRSCSNNNNNNSVSTSSSVKGWWSWMTGVQTAQTARRDILEACRIDEECALQEMATDRDRRVREGDDNNDNNILSESIGPSSGTFRSEEEKRKGDQLLSMLDAQRWTSDQRLILAKEFGMDDWKEDSDTVESLTCSGDDSDNNNNNNNTERLRLGSLNASGVRDGLGSKWGSIGNNCTVFNMEDFPPVPPSVLGTGRRYRGYVDPTNNNINNIINNKNTPKSLRTKHLTSSKKKNKSLTNANNEADIRLSVLFQLKDISAEVLDYNGKAFALFAMTGATVTHRISLGDTSASLISIQSIRILDPGHLNVRPIMTPRICPAVNSNNNNNNNKDNNNNIKDLTTSSSQQSPSDKAITTDKRNPSSNNNNPKVLSIQFYKLDTAISDGLQYRAIVNIEPLDFCFNVPWIQQCVSFWGVSTSLVSDDIRSKRADSGAATVSDGTVTDDRVRSISPLILLMMKIDTTTLIQYSLNIKSFNIIIPETSTYHYSAADTAAARATDGNISSNKKKKILSLMQECCIQFPFISIYNDPSFNIDRVKLLKKIKATARHLSQKAPNVSVEETGLVVKNPSILRKDKNTSSRRGGVAFLGSAITGASDWVFPEGIETEHFYNHIFIRFEDAKVNCSYIDPTTAYSPQICKDLISHDFIDKTSFSIHYKLSLVQADYPSLPSRCIDIDIDDKLSLEGPRKIWLLFVSAMTLLMEFLNNVNGRGSKLVEQGKIFRKDDGGVTFHSRVIGPFQGYQYESEDPRTENQKKFAAPVAIQERFVEVNFGSLIAYHASWPSMPYCQLELRQGAVNFRENDEYDLQKYATSLFPCTVTIFVHAGGADHEVRKGLSLARETLKRYGIPVMESLPHQKETVEFCVTMLELENKLSRDMKAEIINAYQIIQSSFHTNPCSTLTLCFPSKAEQSRFVVAIQRNISKEGFVVIDPDRISHRGAAAPSLVTQNQKSIEFTLNIPRGLRLMAIEQEETREDRERMRKFKRWEKEQRGLSLCDNDSSMHIDGDVLTSNNNNTSQTVSWRYLEGDTSSNDEDSDREDFYNVEQYDDASASPLVHMFPNSSNKNKNTKNGKRVVEPIIALAELKDQVTIGFSVSLFKHCVNITADSFALYGSKPALTSELRSYALRQQVYKKMNDLKNSNCCVGYNGDGSSVTIPPLSPAGGPFIRSTSSIGNECDSGNITIEEDSRSGGLLHEVVSSFVEALKKSDSISINNNCRSETATFKDTLNDSGGWSDVPSDLVHSGKFIPPECQQVPVSTFFRQRCKRQRVSYPGKESEIDTELLLGRSDITYPQPDSPKNAHNDDNDTVLCDVERVFVVESPKLGYSDSDIENSVNTGDGACGDDGKPSTPHPDLPDLPDTCLFINFTGSWLPGITPALRIHTSTDVNLRINDALLQSIEVLWDLMEYLTMRNLALITIRGCRFACEHHLPCRQYKNLNFGIMRTSQEYENRNYARDDVLATMGLLKGGSDEIKKEYLRQLRQQFDNQKLSSAANVSGIGHPSLTVVEQKLLEAELPPPSPFHANSLVDIMSVELDCEGRVTVDCFHDYTAVVKLSRPNAKAATEDTIPSGEQSLSSGTGSSKLRKCDIDTDFNKDTSEVLQEEKKSKANQTNIPEPLPAFPPSGALSRSGHIDKLPVLRLLAEDGIKFKWRNSPVMNETKVLLFRPFLFCKSYVGRRDIESGNLKHSDACASGKDIHTASSQLPSKPNLTENGRLYEVLIAPKGRIAIPNPSKDPEENNISYLEKRRRETNSLFFLSLPPLPDGTVTFGYKILYKPPNISRQDWILAPPTIFGGIDNLKTTSTSRYGNSSECQSNVFQKQPSQLGKRTTDTQFYTSKVNTSGFQFTQFLTLCAESLKLQYSSQSTIKTMLEYFSNGFALRGMYISQRPSILVTSDLSGRLWSWKRLRRVLHSPDGSMSGLKRKLKINEISTGRKVSLMETLRSNPPGDFSFCLLHQHIEFKNIDAVLPYNENQRCNILARANNISMWSEIEQSKVRNSKGMSITGVCDLNPSFMESTVALRMKHQGLRMWVVSDPFLSFMKTQNPRAKSFKLSPSGQECCSPNPNLERHFSYHGRRKNTTSSISHKRSSVHPPSRLGELSHPETDNILENRLRSKSDYVKSEANGENTPVPHLTRKATIGTTSKSGRSKTVIIDSNITYLSVPRNRNKNRDNDIFYSLEHQMSSLNHHNRIYCSNGYDPGSPLIDINQQSPKTSTSSYFNFENSVLSILPADFSTDLLLKTSICEGVDNPHGKAAHLITSRDITEVVTGLSLSFNIFWELYNPQKKLSVQKLELHFDTLMFHGNTRQLAAVFDWNLGCFMSSWNPLYPVGSPAEKPFLSVSQWLEKHCKDLYTHYYLSPPQPSLPRAKDPLSVVSYEWAIGAERICIHIRDPETRVKSLKSVARRSGSVAVGVVLESSQSPTVHFSTTNLNDNNYIPNTSFTSSFTGHNISMCASPAQPAIIRDPIDIVFDLSRGMLCELQWMSDLSFRSRYSFGDVSGWDIFPGTLRNRVTDSTFLERVDEVVSSKRRILHFSQIDNINSNRPNEGNSDVSCQQNATCKERKREVILSDIGSTSDNILDTPSEQSVNSTICASVAEFPAAVEDPSPMLIGGNKSLSFIQKDTTATKDRHHSSQYMKQSVLKAFDPSSACIDIFFGWTSGGPETKVTYLNIKIGKIHLQVVPRFLMDTKDSLFSLTLRNSVAPMLRWPIYTVGSPPPKSWDPSIQQEWSIHNTITVKSLSTTLLEDPVSIKNHTPIFYMSLNDITASTFSSQFDKKRIMKFDLKEICSNGVFDSKSNLFPIIVPQTGANHEREYLITLRKDTDNGLVGEIGCLWFFSPLKEKLYALKESIAHPSMQELVWWNTFAEERHNLVNSENRNPVLSTAAKEPSIEDNIYFSIHNPCLVIAEHATLESDNKKGIIVNFGLLVMSKKVVKTKIDVEMSHEHSTVQSPDACTTTTEQKMATFSDVCIETEEHDKVNVTKDNTMIHYSLEFLRANVTSLHINDHYLLDPTNLVASGVVSVDGLRATANVQLDGIVVDITQEYYESLLNSAARHLVADEENLVKEQQELATKGLGGPGSTTGDAKVNMIPGISLWAWNEDSRCGMRWKMSVEKKAPVSRNKERTGKLFENVPFSHSVTGSPVLRDSLQPSTESMEYVQLPKVKVCTDTEAVPPILMKDLKVRVEWTYLKVRIHSDTVAVYINGKDMRLTGHTKEPQLPPNMPSSSVIYLPLPINDTDDKNSSAKAGTQPPDVIKQEFFDEELHDNKMLLVPSWEVTLYANMQGIELGVESRVPLLTLSSADRSAPLTAMVKLTHHVRSYKADVGICQIALEHETVVKAISFLYEPYRRIVLPRYGISELREYSDNTSFNERVVLCSRTVMKFSSKKFNRITLRFNGNELHFIDAGVPIMTLDPGLTVEITGAKVFLYGYPVEHFLSTANGSFVVLDPLYNEIVEVQKKEYSDDEMNDQDGDVIIANDYDLNESINDNSQEFEEEKHSSDSASAGQIRNVKNTLIDTRDDEVPKESDTLFFSPIEDLKRNQRLGRAPFPTIVNYSIEGALYIILPEESTDSTVGVRTNPVNVPLSSDTTRALSVRVVMLLNYSSKTSPFMRFTGVPCSHGIIHRTDNTADGEIKKLSNLTRDTWPIEVKESGTIELKTIQAECEYFARGSMARKDYSSIVSHWGVNVGVNGRQYKGGLLGTTSGDISSAVAISDVPSVNNSHVIEIFKPYGAMNDREADEPDGECVAFAPTPFQRVVRLSAEKNVDIRIRYGDIQLVSSSVAHAQRAFGHIETEVFCAVKSTELNPDVENLDGHTKEQQERAAKQHSITQIILNIPQIGISCVDDSLGNSVESPMLNITIFNLQAPTCELSSYVNKIHFFLEAKIEYYNMYSGAWSPMLERVSMDVVMRQTKNVSLEDVYTRKGSIKTGLHIRDMHFHLTPMFAETIGRILELKARFEANYQSISVAALPSSLDVNAPEPSTTVLEGGTEAVTKGHRSIGHIDRAGENSKTSDKTFFSYTVTHQLNRTVTIGFAQDTDNRFPDDCDINSGDVFKFNFPRIDGRELPPSQHFITVKTHDHATPVHIGRVGLTYVPLRAGANVQHLVAEITVKEGRKSVLLRTNVKFHNHLPFKINIPAVGILQENESIVVPQNALRKRCKFIPVIDKKCREVSFGTCFDTLTHFYEQRFYCKSFIDEEASLQKACYFLLSFGQYTTINGCSFLDCNATFEAPFSIVNNTGQQIEVGLHYRHMNPQKTRSILTLFGNNYFYSHVTTINIENEQSYPVTQIDPFQDLYINIVCSQADGGSMAATGSDKKSNQAYALIRSKSFENRETSLAVRDVNGEVLVICISYVGSKVILYCPYWILNQSQHYLQVATTAQSSKKRSVLCAGMKSDGLSPMQEVPFLINTLKMHKKPEDAYIYVRIGRYSSGGNISWSEWSQRLPINAIGKMSVISCGDGKDCITLSYSVSFVGGAMKDTRVVKVTPRWIVINRCSNNLTIQQFRMDPGAIIHSGHSHVLDRCVSTGVNYVRLRHGDTEANNKSVLDAYRALPESARRHQYPDNFITSCSWSPQINIDTLGDHALNIRYTVYKDGVERKESYVVHVTCYSRSSVLMLRIDIPNKAPHLIENRTNYLVFARQRNATAEQLTIYPRTTSGFVWDDAFCSPVLLIWASQGSQTSRPVTINLEPAMLVRQSWSQFHQELMFPSGVRLYVRVRDFGGSYGISITDDDRIDRTRIIPFKQCSYQLQVDSINVLVADNLGGDVLLLTAGLEGGGITLCVAQGKSDTADEDELTVEATVGLVQLVDERAQTKQRVVAQTLDRRTSSIYVCRRMQRITPMLLLPCVEVMVQPITIHLEDNFLFAMINLYEKCATSLLGKKTKLVKASQFAPEWHDELTVPIVSQDSIQNRMTFVEHLEVSQIILSLSLYRSHSNDDPIREKLGIISLLIRSVNDARFDWRKIVYDNIYDRLWLLVTFFSNYYSIELQRQMLNVVHVAGLDFMRGFVTDLLEGYFASSAPTHIDRTAALVPRRDMIDFRETTNIHRPSMMYTEEETPRKPVKEAKNSNFGSAVLKLINKDSGFRGRKGRRSSAMEEFANTVPWDKFITTVTPLELHQWGHHAVHRLLRNINLGDAVSPSLCNRCQYIDDLRQERFHSDCISILPHPDGGLIEWCEFAHHCSWEEIVSVCSPFEVMKHIDLFKNSIIGNSVNVIRIDERTEAILRQSKRRSCDEEKEDAGNDNESAVSSHAA